MPDIRDYILEEPAEEKEKEQKTKAKAEFEYTELLSMPPDGIYQKKGKRSETILALIPTKGQYYIKSGNGDPEPITPENVRKFFLHLEDPLPSSIEWISRFEKGKRFAEDFCNFITKNGDKIKLGIANFGERYNDLAEIYEYSPALTNHLVRTRRSVPKVPPIQINTWRSFQPCACGAFESGDYSDKILYLVIFEKLFGLDATKNFVNAMADRDFNFSCNVHVVSELINEFYASYGIDHVVNVDRYNRLAKGITVKDLGKSKNIPHIDIRGFTEYCLTYQREGYSSLEDFFRELADDWKMQSALFHEIKERYPANLATHHNVHALRYIFVKDESDKEKFAKSVAKMKPNEWSNDEYIVKAPDTVDDMIEEATQQGNCLHTYIGKVVEGYVSIYFLRKKKEPDTSLITIEVNDGQVVQAKARFNHIPKEKEQGIIRAWAKAKGLSVSATV